MAASQRNPLRPLTNHPLVRSILLTAAAGIVLVSIFPLANFSYDLSTWLKPEMTITNAALVYVNQETLDILGAADGKLDRTCYARLLDRLTDAGVKCVLMDVLFPSNSTPEADQALAVAIRKNKGVILAIAFQEQRHGSAALVSVRTGPIPLFGEAAKEIGHDKLWGNIVRKIPGNYYSMRSAAWMAAVNLNTNLLLENPKRERWLNYYGPPESDAIPGRSLQDVLFSNIPPGFLNKEVVIVGQNFPYGIVATLRDTFGTPYSRFGSAPMPGVMIHATALSNLMRHDWLTEMPLLLQWLVAALWALTIVGLLYLLSRRSRFVPIATAVAGAAGLCAISLFLQWHLRLWWAWVGPVLAQTPLALILVMRHPKPDPYIAFISYRRKDDFETALLIQRSLADMGLKTFIDQKSLNAGRFDKQLLREIEASTFFIPILSPNSLDRCAEGGDWVLRELSHALANRKKIVPVIKNGFSFEAPGIPELWQIATLKTYHGVIYRNSDFDGFMEKLKHLLVCS